MRFLKPAFLFLAIAALAACGGAFTPQTSASVPAAALKPNCHIPIDAVGLHSVIHSNCDNIGGPGQGGTPPPKPPG